MTEWFDVCNERDEVVGRLPRPVVHQRRLLHRAVQILVFTPRGECFVHRRSATKDESPRLWNASASGHVAAGETYHASAVRELAEELGLAASVVEADAFHRLSKPPPCGVLVPLARFPASPETAWEHTMLYRLVTEEQPRPDPAEIDELRLVPWNELPQRIPRDGWTTNLSVLWDWYQHSGAWPAAKTA